MSVELKSLAAQLDKNQAAEDEAVAYIEGLSEKMHSETDHVKILEYAALIGHVSSAVAAQQASLAAISETLATSEKGIKEVCEGVTKAGVTKAKPKKETEAPAEKDVPEETEGKEPHATSAHHTKTHAHDKGKK